VLLELEPTQVLQAMLAQTELLVIMELELQLEVQATLEQTEMLVLMELDALLAMREVQAVQAIKVHQVQEQTQGSLAPPVRMEMQEPPEVEEH
jgi:hypothetical protein